MLFLQTGLGVDFCDFWNSNLESQFLSLSRLYIPVSPHQVFLSLSAPPCIEGKPSNTCWDEGFFFPLLNVIFSLEADRLECIFLLILVWNQHLDSHSKYMKQIDVNCLAQGHEPGLSHPGSDLRHTYPAVSNCCSADFVRSGSGWNNLVLALKLLCTSLQSDLRTLLSVLCLAWEYSP